jgi:hypothetical protein
MTDDQIEVLRKMASVRGDAMRFDYAANGGRSFKIGRKRAPDGSLLIAVFNWADDEASFSVPVTKGGMCECTCCGCGHCSCGPDCSYAVTDFWSGEAVGMFKPDAKIELTIPAHGARVFRLVCDC